MIRIVENTITESDIIQDDLDKSDAFWSNKLNDLFRIAGENNLVDKLLHKVADESVLSELNNFLFDVYDNGDIEDISEEEILDSIQEYLN